MATKLSAAQARASFVKRAPIIMGRLMADFPSLDVEGSAAILANLGGESRLQAVAEERPTVRGSRGGFGWSQSTGARRRAAEAFWAKRNLDPSSDAAQYAWLFYELRYTPEKRVLAALTRPGLDFHAKIRVFCQVFERPGMPNYAGRYAWGALALQAWHDNPQPTGPLAGNTPEPVEIVHGEDKLSPFEVRALQEQLHRAGFGALLGTYGAKRNGVDGSYGPKTEGAVFAFQRKSGLPADGHWSDATRLALAEATRPASSHQPEKDTSVITIDTSRLPASGKLVGAAGALGSLALVFGYPEIAKMLGFVTPENLEALSRLVAAGGGVISIVAGMLPSSKPGA